MTNEEIDEIVLRVYRARLNAACAGDADRMVAKDGDDGAKQRRRAQSYRPIVVETLIQTGLIEPRHNPVRFTKPTPPAPAPGVFD